MPRVTVDKTLAVAAPASLAWAKVTNWPGHGDWIPLTKVEIVGDGTARVLGGRFRAWSGVGPVGFWDPLTVTAWEERPDGGGHCELVHTGRVVRGDAAITVAPTGEHTCELRWVEHFDLSRPELVGWRIGGRLLTGGIERALARLVSQMEASA